MINNYLRFLIILLCVALMVPVYSMAFDQWPDTGQTTSFTETPGEDSDYTGLSQSYTKLGADGVELLDTATASDGWIMTRDNITQLVWEVKTQTSSIHDSTDTYTWCDTNNDTNGGHRGTCSDGGDTMDFIADVNNENFGGFSDWRLPTERELSTIVNSNYTYPAINITFFPNTVSDGYWTSITTAHLTDHAWRVDFGTGSVRYGHYKYLNYYVRAVRNAQ